ncbi:unnamed protein product [Clonostachys rosea f. rosea IK726]|jgi:hypothetical protein|uniref:Uncharacterized protein n=1 Tax=Clonostachys rosea f. rosea IK726 TaxID=1349383 RepID=A0ACA9U0P4_BIOOC|nr:unnamed protein product [Clonostachys rosea f. rosea IK726]
MARKLHEAVMKMEKENCEKEYVWEAGTIISLRAASINLRTDGSQALEPLRVQRSIMILAVLE